MTTPADDDAARRLRASELIRAAEESMQRRWFGALTRWMDRTRPQVIGPDGLMPQNVAQNRAFWGQLMEDEVIPEAAGLFTRVRNRVLGRREPVTDPDAAAYLNEVSNRLVRLPDEVYSLIVRELEAGHALGESIPDLSARVATVLTATGSEYWPNRARTVARTETMAAVNAGAFSGAVRDAADRGDLAPMKVWLATDDARVRPTHDAADGQRTLLQSPFIVGNAPLQFPGDPRGPAQEVINCFPGDVRVSVPSGLVAVFRRWYEGPMLRVQMSDGVELSATPNHPLLTDSGWKTVEDLETGDQLCGPAVGPGVSTGEPDVEDAPPSFHELYRASVQSGVSSRVSGRTVDFHSDGSNSEVEVVFPDLDLFTEQDLSKSETVRDQSFVRLDNGASTLTLLSRPERGNGTADRAELRSESLSVGFVSSGSPSLPLLRGGSLHTDPVGFAASSYRETQLAQSTDNERSADPEMIRKTLHGLPSGMTFRQVVKVDRYAFSGHVYNLQSGDGWYIANNTASGNCRCTFLPVTLGETVDWTDRQDP